MVATEHLGKEQGRGPSADRRRRSPCGGTAGESKHGGLRQLLPRCTHDLLRAGLSALERQGLPLLEGQSPLLKETLLVMIGELAQTRDAEFFTTDTV